MSVLKAHELKGAKTYLAKLQAELATLNRERAALDQRIAKARGQIQQQEKLIKSLKEATDDGPLVTEHALLRYLERVEGIDLEAVRKRMLEGREDAIRTLGSCKIKAENGVTLVVRDGSVVSVNA